MRVHDENDLAGGAKRAVNPTKNDAAGEIEAAIANPHQASVQTMLEVQRLAGNAGVNSLLQREEDGGQARSPVLDVVGQGGGSPLDGSLRGEMEGRLGGDFSDVKIHTDSKASQSASAVQANAYTVGNEVVVKQDRWSPSTEEGKKTIAHELTHVMQQREGPVEGTSQGDGVSVSHPADRFERAAESNAETAMAGPAPSTASAQMQREAAPEEEEEAQMQREAAPEEEEEAQMQREAAPEEEEEGVQTQREAAPEEEEEAQMQREAAPEEEEEAQMQRSVQRHADHAEESAPTAA